MELRLLFILACLLVSAVVSHAALPSHVYWDTVLPNTPMPEVVRDRLRPDLEEEKSVNLGRKGEAVNTGPKAKLALGVHPGSNALFDYNSAASEDQLLQDPSLSPFILESDLHTGTKINFRFPKITSGTTFLPSHVAKTIPFSSKKFPEIFNSFSVEPQSEEAKLMKETIQICEEPAQKGVDKYCATSLESMIDFSTSKLGRDVQVMMTDVDYEEDRNNNNKQQYYSIAGGVEKIVGDKSVVCHGMNYVYAVFYCHATHNTTAYVIPLIDANGNKFKAIAGCHADTSTWNPKHLAFQSLKVKPGTVSICHFLYDDHLLWVPN